MAFESEFGPQYVDMGPTNSLFNWYQEDTLKINGLMDIVDKFDVVLFSVENTLIKEGLTLPAGAVLVPQLRQMGKKLAVFTVDDRYSRQELTDKMNSHGLSFAQERILQRGDLAKLAERFPLASQRRILMVCSDLVSEVTLGQSHQLTTLLVISDRQDKTQAMGIEPDFISFSV
ncbi:hypothetical protein MTBPR1_10163 [Candidatus Terasakiella magnetica]|uniref:Uncharacterized protein n=1 Tax=Candidatus Terasakiella magnetica TaxID=1867952 RepID=A0A1C3RCA7_9PROT|nr:hypothetical protein [Candidatus Terasakiella magnetica]SCA54916.1 hypothetical protein MTBPR1_10163 [Candidatus Terasakiella magnetica]